MSASPDRINQHHDKARREATRAETVARRLDVPSPGLHEAEPQLSSVIRLRITDVRPYDRNPRRASHERITELKESIRANGIEQIVTVTRRPEGNHYVVAKGGNSRVTAATALYEETRNDRFLFYDFVYVPYPGEAKLLAAHLRENDQRADLCFWDKANGYLSLKADLERERASPLSLREFSRILEEEGTPVSHVLLALFQFAVDRLSALGPATEYLSRRAVVDVIQPAIGALMRLIRRLDLDDAWLQQQVIDPELVHISAGFTSVSARGERSASLDAGALARAFRTRCASVLSVSPEGLDRMMRLQEKAPDMSAEELRRSGSDFIGTASISRAEADNPASHGQFEHSAAPRSHVAPYRQSGTTTASEADTTRIPDVGQVGQEDTREPALRDGPSGATSDSRLAGTADAFRSAVRSFAQTCGLEGCVEDAPGLPYGFMVEPPSSDVLPQALDSLARRDAAELNRYLGWWWLVSLSRQNTAYGLEQVPKQSRYAQMARDEDRWARMCDTHVGEPLLADRMDVMFAVMLNPDRPIGLWWAQLIQIARAFRAAHPERFSSPRWPELDADERLVRGEGA
ncbi:ParB N-terminal domain-containing protein [Paraburkholderia sp. USG1]|uniref:ParB N-terminal domain-containing protein n=1 Tax=Paraburkholderia sp. USG1 TaxID=2952268 RepID=UPI002860DFCC|nr:ParB N-terminal domain-containing protein [Paraburkholderia sp. USG1]MDR8398424.1 ParB N-terminal domain-containing protein [Paraburkholderia sp. USG1]